MTWRTLKYDFFLIEICLLIISDGLVLHSLSLISALHGGFIRSEFKYIPVDLVLDTLQGLQ